MSLTPDDITGVPFTGSASRMDCDPSSTIANLYLPFPLFSSNMESVTGSKLAITLALMGGVGTIHQFQSIEDQVRDIKKVKQALVNRIVIDGRTYKPALDAQKRLIVAGATGIRNDFLPRVKAIISAGADILVLDIAHGDSGQMFDAVKSVRREYPKVKLMVGNVITPKAAYMYCKIGVNIIKANVGPGFACTTRKITGFGVPTISGLYDVVTVADKFGVDVIADGGVNNSGIAVKYFATGCKGIMIGTKLGCTSDSPEAEKRRNKGKGMIKIWGSASSRAKEAQGRPRWDIAEGKTIESKYLGDTSIFISGLITGVQSGLSYAGVSSDGKNNLSRLAKHSRWSLQTVAGIYEGTKEINGS